MSTQAPARRERIRSGGERRHPSETMGARPSESPLKFLPKNFAKEEGMGVRIRVMTTHPDECRQIDCRIARRVVTVNNKSKEFKDPIHEAIYAGDPKREIARNDLSSYVDQQGNQIADKKNFSSLYRIPVWVYDVQGKTGPRNQPGPVTPIEQLMYWEMSYPMFKEFLELEDNKQLDLRFSEDDFKPYYDILIYRGAENGQKTWELLGLENDPEKRGQKHPNYDVDDEVALGEANMKIVDEQWPDLQDAMDEIMTADQIRFVIGSNQQEKEKGAMASKPSMPGAEAEAEVEAEVVSEDDTKRNVAPAQAEAPEAAEPQAEASETDTNRTIGGGSGSFTRRRPSRVA